MIKRNILRINKNNIDKTIYFYAKLLGFQYHKEEITKDLYIPQLKTNILHIFKYEKPIEADNITEVCFVEDVDFLSNYNDSGYWKIGIALHDVDAAVNILQKNDIKVNHGIQFLDVGYLTSLQDPNGYSIELLQHQFQSNFQAIPGKTTILGQPACTPPHIGQITLRCIDHTAAHNFYINSLGMKLICVEDLSAHVMFNLYFYGYTNETTPNTDVKSIANREWTYQRNFTQIEFQHYTNLKSDFHYVVSSKNFKTGHVGIELTLSNDAYQTICSKYANNLEEHDNQKFSVLDPDGYRYFISSYEK